MKLILIAILFLTSTSTFAEDGICTTKPGFDPAHSYCEYNTPENICSAYWEECIWIPNTSGTCQPRDPKSVNYCDKFEEKYSCNTIPECIWN